MIGLRPEHIILIIFVAVIIFAPTRIVQLIRGFKNMFSQFRDEVGSKNQTKKNATDSPNKTKS